MTGFKIVFTLPSDRYEFAVEEKGASELLKDLVVEANFDDVSLEYGNIDGLAKVFGVRDCCLNLCRALNPRKG